MCYHTFVIKKIKIKKRNANQNFIIRSQIITRVDEDVEELKPTYIAGGNVQRHNHSGNSLAIPEMINHGITKWLRNLAPKYKHRELKMYVSIKTCA